MTTKHGAPAWDKSTPLDEGRRAGLSARVRRSGLLAEIRVAQHVASAGWMTSLRPNYHDRDTKKTREYDVAIVSPSTRYEDTEHGRVVTRLCAAVEVKAARDTPWVLVRPPEGTMREGGNPAPVAVARSFPLDLDRWLSGVLRGKDHPLVLAGDDSVCWTAASLIEPFQDSCTACGHRRRGPAASFKATYTAAKAIHDLVAREGVRAEEGFKKRFDGLVSRGSALTVGRPVIALDGRLLGFWARQDGSEVWSTLDAGTLEFELQTGHYPLRTFRIDVVTVDYFPKYMEFLTRIVDVLHDDHVTTFAREGPRVLH